MHTTTIDNQRFNYWITWVDTLSRLRLANPGIATSQVVGRESHNVTIVYLWVESASLKKYSMKYVVFWDILFLASRTISTWPQSLQMVI